MQKNDDGALAVTNALGAEFAGCASRTHRDAFMKAATSPPRRNEPSP